ncbi:MAG TPA: hypothetical protein VM408_02820 [Methylomirabilota bacterium]|nr:hypothetical protein [Methylomirabilota bacterium]
MNAVEGSGIATRDPDLVLARLHLRLGSLALARAELETLAGRDALDEAGLLDLAEARWRTGDITGAGEAAVAALRDEEGPLLALVVAAEAAAAKGRPTEARRLADKAMEAAAGSIDALFAGMPRAAVWPPDATAPPPSPTTMFDAPRRPISAAHRHPRPHDTARPAASTTVVAVGNDPAGGEEADAATIGLWDGTGPAHDGVGADGELVDRSDAADDLPSAEQELDLGRAALQAGDADDAAVRLGLAIRVAPALAPAVIDLIAGRTERAIALVRGDAYRLVGRELEARRAFVEAARGPSWPPPAPESSPDPPTQPSPTVDPPSQGDAT